MKKKKKRNTYITICKIDNQLAVGCRAPKAGGLTVWRDGAGREVAGGFRMEGTHVYLWPIHTDVWQKPSQHCNYPPIKINK